jgi:hypothetical protein
MQDAVQFDHLPVEIAQERERQVVRLGERLERERTVDAYADQARLVTCR